MLTFLAFIVDFIFYKLVVYAEINHFNPRTLTLFLKRAEKAGKHFKLQDEPLKTTHFQF